MEVSLELRRFFRCSLLAGAALFLLWLAWQALSGGFRQLARSRTAGQKVETVVQLECGLLSLLMLLTSLRWRRWAKPIRVAWSISLVTTAALSALVWGPPMPVIALLFAAIALLLSRATSAVLRLFSIA